MMLQETWTLTHSRHYEQLRFNPDGLPLGVGAKVFLVKAVVNSTDRRNRPFYASKMIFGIKE